MGLTELLINAIEHGWLGVGHERKRHWLETGQWPQRREALMVARGKRCLPVTLECVYLGDELCYRIRDCGKGFAPARWLDRMPDKAAPCGRGLWLARTLGFDRLVVVPPGNRIDAFVRCRRPITFASDSRPDC